VGRGGKAIEKITRLDSTYQDAPALLNRARREQEQAAAELAEDQARRQADQQAGQAEQQAQRQGEEQARRET
jgi:hypothetical protein